MAIYSPLHKLKIKIAIRKKWKDPKYLLKQRKHTYIGLKNPNWKGGRYELSPGGYVYVYQPLHPLCTKNGYVLEHRLAMEKVIKRYLTPKEEVHHNNEIKNDNRKENLTLFASKNKHVTFHNNLRELKKEYAKSINFYL